MIELSDLDLVRVMRGHSLVIEDHDPTHLWIWERRETAVSRLRDAINSIPTSPVRRDSSISWSTYLLDDDWPLYATKVVSAFEAYPLRMLDDGWVNRHDAITAMTRLLDIYRPIGVDFLYIEYMNSAINLAVRRLWLEQGTIASDEDDYNALRLLAGGDKAVAPNGQASTVSRPSTSSDKPPMGVKTSEAFVYIRNNPGKSKREVAEAAGIYFDSFGYHWDILRANGCRLGLRNRGCYPPNYDFSSRLTG